MSSWPPRDVIFITSFFLIVLLVVDLFILETIAESPLRATPHVDGFGPPSGPAPRWQLAPLTATRTLLPILHPLQWPHSAGPETQALPKGSDSLSAQSERLPGTDLAFFGSMAFSYSFLYCEGQSVWVLQQNLNRMTQNKNKNCVLVIAVCMCRKCHLLSCLPNRSSNTQVKPPQWEN